MHKAKNGSIPLKRWSNTFLLGCLLFAGCSSQHTKFALSDDTPQPEEKPVKTLKVPDKRFDVDTLYALLVAEVAIDRRRFDVALGNYVQQASATKDAEVTARATHIARILKSHSSALEMATLWTELEPDNENAQVILTAELIEANKLTEASALAKTMLQNGNDSAFDTIAVKAVENDIQVVRDLLGIYQPLTQQATHSLSLWLGYSILLQKNEQLDDALRAAKNALDIEPNNVRAAFQETRVLQQMGKQDLALERLGAMVEANPRNIGLRAKYARILANSDLPASREQFEILHLQAPKDPEILFSLALVEKESGLLDKAVKHFEALLDSGYYSSAAHFHLGILREKQESTEQALFHYSNVQPGQNYLNAIIKTSGILMKSNREYEALELVREKRSSSPETYAERFYMLESDVLSSSGQISAAELTLNNALKAYPESTNLLYSRAMLYSRTGSIVAAEKDLRAILNIAPKNAAALNALGYTLADRTDRIDEAYGLIKEALALTPEDPAVLDSMGWVEYRRGNYQVASELLAQAMKIMPDHEIAAHLGEVLWVIGSREEARAAWRKGLKLKPASEIILKTIDRLEADLD